MRIRFHDEARTEFLLAAEWYERERPGLGDEFIEQVSKGLETIASQPEAWPAWIEQTGTSLRRFVLPRFPYSVIFAARERELFVVAVAHGKRQPKYWASRVDDER